MSFILMVGVVIILLLLQLPQIWINRIIKMYNYPNSLILGSGSQFLKHLIDKFKLHSIEVKETKLYSFYDPRKKIIYLEESIYNNKSISALTIAAHEFAHALQDSQNIAGFIFRSWLAKFMLFLRFLSIFGVIFSFSIGLFTHNRIFLLVSIITYIIPGMIQLIFAFLTLPLEWDASFNRAYPIITKGNYLPKEDYLKVRQLLFGAYLTYLAGALSQLLNIFQFRSIYSR